MFSIRDAADKSHRNRLRQPAEMSDERWEEVVEFIRTAPRTYAKMQQKELKAAIENPMLEHVKEAFEILRSWYTSALGEDLTAADISAAVTKVVQKKRAAAEAKVQAEEQEK